MLSMKYPAYADSETPTATFPSFYERFSKNKVHYQTQLNLQSPSQRGLNAPADSKPVSYGNP